MPDMEIQTQIVFDDHIMRLMFRAKNAVDETYNYIVHSAWKPPMENILESKSSMKTLIGSKVTRTVYCTLCAPFSLPV